MKKIALSNEILGSFLASKAESIDELQADPKTYIYAHYNVDIPADITTVQNTASQVNLVLPYYSFLDDLTAEQWEDEQMQEIAGGDVFVTMTVAVLVAIACTITAGGVVLGSVGSVLITQADKK